MKFKEFLFTSFYAGYFPVAPGTAGSLVGMIFFIIEYFAFGKMVWAANLVMVAVMFYPSIKLADEGEKFFGKKDPGEVVIDEVLGYWISVLFLPFSWTVAILAFFLFRFMDILKPFPAGRVQLLRGGVGIVLDDCVAGMYANIALRIIIAVMNAANLPIY